MSITIEGTKKGPFRVVVAIVTITTEADGTQTQKQTIAVEEGSPDAKTNAAKVWALESAVYPAAKAALAGLSGASRGWSRPGRKIQIGCNHEGEGDA